MYVKTAKNIVLPQILAVFVLNAPWIAHRVLPWTALSCPLAIFFSFHTFLYFVVLVCARLSLFSFSAAPFSSRLGAPTVSFIIIPELLPFSSFSLARYALNMPNANLMACSIVVSFYFVSFSSSIIIGSGFGSVNVLGDFMGR